MVRCMFCHQQFNLSEDCGFCPICGVAYIAGEANLDAARAELVALVHGGYYDPTEPEFWQLKVQGTYGERPVIFGWDPSEKINTEKVAQALGVSRTHVWRLIREGKLEASWDTPADERSERGKRRLVSRAAVEAYHRE